MQSRISTLEAVLRLAKERLPYLEGFPSINLDCLPDDIFEPVYAIPDRILNSLEIRLPKLLTAYELKLERDYSSICRRFDAFAIDHKCFVQHWFFRRKEPFHLTDEMVHESRWDLPWSAQVIQATLNDAIRSIAHTRMTSPRDQTEPRDSEN